MKTELTKIFPQIDSKGFDQSDLVFKVEVDIDTREHTGDFSQPISIFAYDYKTKVYTDLTHIFFNCFHDEAEKIIENIDWWEVYRETKETVAA